MHHPITFMLAVLRFAIVYLLAFAFAGAPLRADITLIPAGSIWKYLDNGTDQGTAWRGNNFADASWPSGPAELGYGDAVEGRPEATVVSYGADAAAKYITTYFRRSFEVGDATAISHLKLRVLRDDGVVVYLNGQEIWRNNLPTGVIGYQTLATTALGGTDEYTFVESIIPSTLLRNGTNVLAAEIHQSNVASTDLSFDLELIGRSPGLVRAPYLQIGTPTSVVVRWRTDAMTDSVVRYGSSPANLNLSASADQGSPVTEHEITLTGLSADSRYYYSVGSSSTVFASGESCVFYTAPPAGKPYPTRVWVLGDAGTGTSAQLAVRDAYYAFAQGAYTDVMLMLGDNVYDSGTDNEYTTRHFNIYDQLLRQTVSWPTIGNHDTAQLSNPSPTIPYYLSFSLPTGGQAGGLPSGTENYYSFDHGDIHFICLDSMTENRGSNGTMANWLRQDLAVSSQRWIIAYWHHPPYSNGHVSDTDTVETEMRANIVPILEDYGVDLVLSGHSHAYERSYLIDGHYGTSSTLSSSMIRDGSDGRGAGGYNKATLDGAGREGAVYAVAGSSGKTENYGGINDTGTGNGTGHPAMFISWERLGSMVIDVDGNRMDVKFLRETGQVADTFAITHGPATNITPSVQITAPVSGSTFNPGAAISINVDASDADQGLSELVFYANGSRIGTVAAVPEQSTYSFAWTPATIGDYQVEARAVDQLGASGLSQLVDVSVGTVSTIPATPENFTATAGSTIIALTWTASAGAESYSVAKLDPTTGIFVPLASGLTQTAYTDSGLQPSTSYTYRATAVNSAGASAPAEVTTVTTPLNPPTAPNSLTVGAVAATSIGLSWVDTASNEEGFQLERSLDGSAFTTLAVLAANTTSYTDATVAAGTTYWYRVLAFNPDGSSAYSNSVSATTTSIPAAPRSLTAAAASKSVIALAWIDASANETGFTVEHSTDNVAFTVLATLPPNATNYQHTGLTPNKMHYYRVRAFNGAGSSAYSNVASAKTSPK